LKAQIVNARINPRSASLSQIPIADIAFVNEGGNMISDYAIGAARTSLIGQQGYAAYGTLGYSKYRYSTGSHIDVKGLSGQIGVSAGTDTGTSNIVAAMFFEFGKGQYDTYNSFEGIPTFHGDGDVSYVGGGILARFDFGSELSNRPYVEGSARIGKSRFDFNSNDFQVSGGQNMLYTFDGRYYGFHAGAGYIVNVDSLGTTFDLSAKFFFTERDSSDFVLDGENVHLEKTQSSRFRTGARVSYAVNDTIKPYAGGYFEYEFDGESVVTVRNHTLKTSSIKGASGMGEIGVILNSLNSPIQFEFCIQGSGGKRDGLGGTMSLSYAF
jgi:hypothetical protein